MTATNRLEEISGSLPDGYDIAVGSLAVHHMPAEKKRLHLANVGEKVDHLAIFEMNADHDYPEQHSPNLSASIYQTYGRAIDFLFAHDAPLDVAIPAVDCFLLTEVVSMLTQPRGQRTEYHMLRNQWHDLLRETLKENYSCWSESASYSDDYVEMFTLHVRTMNRWHASAGVPGVGTIGLATFSMPKGHSSPPLAQE